MSINPLNDISSVYVKEVFKPQLGKSAPGGDGAKKVEKGKDDAESSAKRIRQATYDIRYRARREDIKLDQAFTQYMGNATMSGPEKAAVKEKLGLTDGGGAAPVKEAVEPNKFKVRVTDKESGKSYVRFATREKINQLRANPNISSVEMTGYGKPYEGEKKKGEATADVASGKGLAKKDYDGDGKKESPAKEYRGAVHNAIQRRKGGTPDGKDTSNVKEDFSNWRQDLSEVMDVVDRQDNEKKITGMKSGQKNDIRTSALKGGITFREAVENMGGELLEMVEVGEEEIQELDEADAPVRKRGGVSAPEGERSIGGEANRRNKDYWASVEGGNRDRGMGSKAKRRAAELNKEEVQIDEKAVSKAQQRFMGMVYATKKGEPAASPEVAAAAKGITGKEARKFAKTKHAGLPEVKEAAPMTPVAQKQQDTQNTQQQNQRSALQDRKLANIQKQQLAAKMKQVQSGVPLKDSYEIEPIEEKNAEIEAKFQKARTPHLLSKFKKEHPGSRQPKKVPGAKETPEQIQSRLTNRQVARAVKHGLTSKEKGETQARAKYDSARD
jgi:hypothetical protein